MLRPAARAFLSLTAVLVSAALCSAGPLAPRDLSNMTVQELQQYEDELFGQSKQESDPAQKQRLAAEAQRVGDRLHVLSGLPTWSGNNPDDLKALSPEALKAKESEVAQKMGQQQDPEKRKAWADVLAWVKDEQSRRQGQAGDASSDASPASRTDAEAAGAPSARPGGPAPGAEASPGSGGGGSGSVGGASGGGGQRDLAVGRSLDGSSGSNALGRARQAGESLKASLPTAEAESQAVSGGAGGSRSGGNPAKPESDRDLALAAVSGFGRSFKAMGLDVAKDAEGRERIVRSDGRPASDTELAALRSRIASEPEALVKRPDFFDVIPQERFSQLKGDFKDQPGLRQTDFRHVGLTSDDRDFDYTQNCNPRLDDDCNPHARGAYEAGEFVSPEDLNAIDEALHPGAGASGSVSAISKGGGRALDSARRAAAGPSPAASGPVWRVYGSRLAALFGGRRRARADAESRIGGSGQGGSPSADAETGPARQSRSFWRWWHGGALVAVVGGWVISRRRKSYFRVDLGRR